MIASAEPAQARQTIQRRADEQQAYLQKTISASRLGLFLQCRSSSTSAMSPRLRRNPRLLGTPDQPFMPFCRTGTCRGGEGSRLKSNATSCCSRHNGPALQAGLNIRWDGEEESERNSSWSALQHYFVRPRSRLTRSPKQSKSQLRPT